MTIKEVEEKVGIKKTNIRFYEEAGLLRPERSKENNYRIYSREDVDILEKIKAFLFKDRIGLPGILGLIPLHNGCQGGLVCFFKLGFYGFCDFCGCVGIDVLQSLLDGICEFLYDFRIFFNIAFLCTICRVGHIAELSPMGGRHMGRFLPVPGRWRRARTRPCKIEYCPCVLI